MCDASGVNLHNNSLVRQCIAAHLVGCLKIKIKTKNLKSPDAVLLVVFCAISFGNVVGEKECQTCIAAFRTCDPGGAVVNWSVIAVREISEMSLIPKRGRSPWHKPRLRKVSV